MLGKSNVTLVFGTFVTTFCKMFIAYLFNIGFFFYQKALNKEGDVSIEETRVPTFIQEISVEDGEAGSHSLDSTCAGNILTDHPTKPFENHCCQAKTYEQ